MNKHDAFVGLSEYIARDVRTEENHLTNRIVAPISEMKDM